MQSVSSWEPLKFKNPSEFEDEQRRKFFLLSKCVRRRRSISPTVAFYRHRDSRRYTAFGPINAAANRRLTRVTKSFLNEEDHAPRLCTNRRSTRDTDHLMRQEIRAPKGEIPSVSQANWQSNHDVARTRTRRPCLFDVYAPSASP